MLPDKIKILGINYDIEEVEEIDNDPGKIGDILFLKSKIRLKNNQSIERKKEVLIHEILHGCFHEAGFEDHDEDMVNRIGKVLHQVLKENDFSFLKQGVTDDKKA